MSMTFETLAGDVTLIRIEGRLDATAAPDFQIQLMTAIAEGKTCLVVDLSNVWFVDSTGLGILVTGLKAARRARGDLRLVAPSAPAMKLLKLTTLDRVFRMGETPDQAWA
jgi:anti-sigma B factor antagonist